jgi:NADH dehydrogenase FAD-containing subunit
MRTSGDQTTRAGIHMVGAGMTGVEMGITAV